MAQGVGLELEQTFALWVAFVLFGLLPFEVVLVVVVADAAVAFTMTMAMAMTMTMTMAMSVTVAVAMPVAIRLCFTRFGLRKSRRKDQEEP